MWLFAGLGNPGDEYANNRHNIGFMAIDEIADRYGFPPFRSKFQGQLSEGKIAGQKIVLLKPQTYMNNSGQSVVAAAKFYKMKTNQVVVFYDELDLEPGKVRVKLGGGAAGHNGIKSMHAHMPDANFWRVRMGIGHPGDKDRVSDYVLSNFSKEDKKWLKILLEAVGIHATLLAEGNDGDFMTKVAMDAPVTTKKKKDDV
jgi:peptidyl-tRNA hydrolase, PTH1 family